MIAIWLCNAGLSANSPSCLSYSHTPSTSSASFIPQNLERKKIMAKASDKFLKLRFHSSVTICSRDCVVIAKENSHQLEGFVGRALIVPGLSSKYAKVKYCSPEHVYLIYIWSIYCSRSAAQSNWHQCIRTSSASMLLQYLNIKGPRFPHPTHEFCMVRIRITCVWMNKDTVQLNMIC